VSPFRAIAFAVALLGAWFAFVLVLVAPLATP
jgi:hypothetical protein